MKEKIKNILKYLGIYYSLQRSYRGAIEFSKKQYYKTTYLKYRGKGYVCNFCGAMYRKFVASYPSPEIANALNSNNVIAGPGENVYCPNCMSKNRERLVKAVIENRLNVRDKHILHFSPEKNLYRYLKEIAKVKTVDISPRFYKNIDNNISYADATSLQFSDSSFDVIIANHILEHIPDDNAAMKEMYRVLNMGGLAILQVPYSETLPDTIEDPYIDDPAKQAKLYGQKDHVRIYSLNRYIGRLENAGFSVRVLTPEELIPFRVHAIQENESVIIGYK
ncbi:MAG: methyltransferase domain-containing protein [Chitinophagaceae bacterium]|nr:methyltransferase domain-containing protein [Chitinophagaceae bacterium]